ncbi:MAG: nitroreductase family protein [Nitrospirae bacterium]|nr:nitroreductase family protein [Nitrospirota bacterium]
MDVLKAVKERRSIRNFQKKELPNDAVDKLIDAIIWAPSAGNLQSRKFYFIKDAELKQQIASAAFGQNFIAETPLTIVACTDNKISKRYGDRGTHLYSIQDVSASIINMMLVAHELGLGTVWVGAFDEWQVFEILNLPKNLRPVAIIPVGYPAKIPSAPRRVSKNEVVEMR